MNFLKDSLGAGIGLFVFFIIYTLFAPHIGLEKTYTCINLSFMIMNTFASLALGFLTTLQAKLFKFSFS